MGQAVKPGSGKLGMDVVLEALRLWNERWGRRVEVLLAHARQCRVERIIRPYLEAIQYYAMERFLYRLSRSPYVERFVLKGALMLREGFLRHLAAVAAV